MKLFSSFQQMRFFRPRFFCGAFAGLKRITVVAGNHLTGSNQKALGGDCRFPFVCRIILLLAISIGLLRANDYGPLGLGELVEGSSLILLVKIVPNGEKFDVEIAEVLKGVPPKDLVIDQRTYSDLVDGREKRGLTFGGDTNVYVEDLTLSKYRILFLFEDESGGFIAGHPACLQLAEKKERVVELLAMMRNPAPFVMSSKYAGDVDLIYVLRREFYPIRVSAPALPALEESVRHEQFSGAWREYMPWQRTRFTLHFTYQDARTPKLQMAPFYGEGVLPDFIRRVDSFQGFERIATRAKEAVPPEFDVTVDTTGPTTVGDLTLADATEFLRGQLQSDRVEVVQAAFQALADLLDSAAVPIAIRMLESPDPAFLREAVVFLGYAKDPRSIDSLCKVIDDLPPFASERYDKDRQFSELCSAVNEAVRNLRDPRIIPALERAVLKGYSGDRISEKLGELGDETAFEPLLSHMRNPKEFLDSGPLVTMVERSNLPVEPWMNETIQYDDHPGKERQSARWIEWWKMNKGKFRIVRSSEESQSLRKH